MQRIRVLAMSLLLLGGMTVCADTSTNSNSPSTTSPSKAVTPSKSNATQPATAPSKGNSNTSTTTGASPNSNATSTDSNNESKPTDSTRSMTPAERQDSKIQKGMSEQDILNSPRAKAQSKMFNSPEHEETYRSLSPKNRVVFDSLSKGDQKRVINSYLNGEDPQRVMMKMLQQDQRTYNKERDGSEDWETQMNRDSPASRAMQSPNRREEAGPESQIFEPGME